MLPLLLLASAASAPATQPVSLGEHSSLSGEPRADDVLIAALGRIPKLARCQDEAQAAGQATTGSLELALIRLPDGAIAEVRKGASDLTAPALESCALDVMSSAIFPPPPAGNPERVLRFTYVFSGDAPPTTTVTTSTAASSEPEPARRPALGHPTSVVRDCYVLVRSRDPEATATVELEFGVTRSGALAPPELEVTGTGGTDFERCVLDRLDEMVLPPGVPGRHSYLLKLGPQG